LLEGKKKGENRVKGTPALLARGAGVVYVRNNAIEGEATKEESNSITWG